MEQRLQKLQNGGSQPGCPSSCPPSQQQGCSVEVPLTWCRAPQDTSGSQPSCPFPVVLSCWHNQHRGKLTAQVGPELSGAMLRACTGTKKALESILQPNCCSPIIPSLCHLPWANRQVTTNTLPNPKLCSSHSYPPRSPGMGRGVARPFTGTVGTPFPPQPVGSYATAFTRTRNCSEGSMQNSMERKLACS